LKKNNQLKIAIIVAKFNYHITNALLAGAKDTLTKHQISEENISITWVPGAFELPFGAQKMAHSLQPDAIICLGAVIRGDTPHFDYVCQAASQGILQVGLNENLPVIFGVLTTNTIEEALERAGLKDAAATKAHLQATPDPTGNKGVDAALAALELLALS
jgi:6,7-dimethyl-8-ribityllumazine synthase